MGAIALSEDVNVSRLIYGWWRLPRWQMRVNDITRRIQECFDRGITSHDHADIYGEYLVESMFGAAFKQTPQLRHTLQLISKCGIKLVSAQRPEHARKTYDTSTSHIVQSAERSLCNLGTDYLDILLIHRPDPLMDVDHVAEAFMQLRQQGKVREFGVSNFLPAQFSLLQSRLNFSLVTNQIEVSVLNHAAFFDGSLAMAQQLRHPVMAWSPLAGGRIFTDTSGSGQQLRNTLQRVAQTHEVGMDHIAYAWLLRHPAKILPVIGSQTIERIQCAVEAQSIRLTTEEWTDIWEAGGSALP